MHASRVFFKARAHREGYRYIEWCDGNPSCLSLDRGFRSGRIATLRSGGLLLEDCGPEQLGYSTGGPSKPANLYTEALMGEAFAPLQILPLDGYDARIEEGRNLAGMAALIELVARKPA